MPRIQSAKKALRQNVRRRERNLARHAMLKKVLKHYQKLVAAKKNEDAGKYLPIVFKTLDKLAKTGYIKRNKASRMKSRLSKKIAQKQ